VAEHTLALLLATLRRLVELDAATRAGNGWGLAPERREAIGEISASTVGLLGYGSVPQRLAPVLAAMGAKVQYWSRSRKDGADAQYVSLEQLVATSDVISLHLPLTGETRGILSRDMISRLKPGA